MRRLRSGAAVVLFLATACVSSRPPAGGAGGSTTGLASWYGEEFAGRATANGEIFNPRELTAAHKTLPFGTIVEVSYPVTGRSVQVRINDRGPFVGNRVIDLSWAAADAIGLVEPGVATVTMRIIGGSEQPVVVPVVAERPPAQRVADPEQPPAIAFPLPESAREPAETPGFRVEVQEQRGTPAAPTEPSMTGHGFVLQLGAFQQEQNAAELRARAEAVDGRIFVQRRGELFRVRVGPVISREAAVELQEKFAAAGLPSVIMPE